MYDRFSVIAEVVSGGDFNESALVENEVNAYLQSGWVLLAVHARGWSNETARYSTVYIFGNQDTRAPRFKYDLISRKVVQR